MSRSYSDRKQAYYAKLDNLLKEYTNILIVNVDNVGSRQMQEVRMALRGKAVILMGKNTMMRKVVREAAETNPDIGKLLPFIVGNIGFIFSHGDLDEIRKVAAENKVPAGAKSGMFAPCDVVLPAGPTTLDPGQTSFFQAMAIATKITRGAIEIVNDVHLIKKSERVSASAVALLSKMGLKPFFFSIVPLTVYENGVVYDASILDLEESDMLAKFFNAVNTVAALSLGGSYPCLASVPHSFSNAFKMLVALSLETEYSFKEADEVKEILKNPGAAAPAATEAAPAAAAPAAAESSESESGDEEFSLFD